MKIPVIHLKRVLAGSRLPSSESTQSNKERRSKERRQEGRQRKKRTKRESMMEVLGEGGMEVSEAAARVSI